MLQHHTSSICPACPRSSAHLQSDAEVLLEQDCWILKDSEPMHPILPGQSRSVFDQASLSWSAACSIELAARACKEVAQCAACG